MINHAVRLDNFALVMIIIEIFYNQLSIHDVIWTIIAALFGVWRSNPEILYSVNGPQQSCCESWKPCNILWFKFQHAALRSAEQLKGAMPAIFSIKTYWNH